MTSNISKKTGPPQVKQTEEKDQTYIDTHKRFNDNRKRDFDKERGQERGGERSGERSGERGQDRKRDSHRNHKKDKHTVIDVLKEQENKHLYSKHFTKDLYNKDVLLKSSWTFYDHIKCDQADYDKNTQIVGHCSSIFEFWTCYNNLPKPSNIFFQKETGKPYYYHDSIKREISAFSIFRDDIRPTWEDPSNIDGATMEYRVPIDTSIESIDTFWLYLCIYCMGLYFGNNVTGFRLVDSSIIGQYKPLYKIEIWTINNNVSLDVEKKFRELFNISNEQKIMIKNHK